MGNTPEQLGCVCFDCGDAMNESQETAAVSDKETKVSQDDPCTCGVDDTDGKLIDYNMM